MFSTRRHKPPPHPEGQATVELALVLPLLAVFTIVMVQFSVVARDQLALWQTAREISRAVALAPDPRAAAGEQSGVGRIITINDGTVEVVLTHRTRLTFAGFSFLRRKMTLRARVSMALEPPVAFETNVGSDEFDRSRP